MYSIGMNKYTKIELAMATVTVKKTKRPNAICINKECKRRFYSYIKSVGFEDLCPECKEKGVEGRYRAKYSED